MNVLLSALRALAPRLGEKLDRDADWAGYLVSEPSGAHYRRVVCREDLVLQAHPERSFLVAVHQFDGFEGGMHDHRWPIAVLPLALDGTPGVPLYDMAWQRPDGTSGTVLVRSGAIWAMRCDERHAVRSRVPHWSLNVSDLTSPPTRENRLGVEPLGAETARALRQQVKHALVRAATSPLTVLQWGLGAAAPATPR